MTTSWHLLAGADFQPKDTLIALVTVETLLLTALAIAVALPAVTGLRRMPILVGGLGTVVLAVIAVGAGAAWWQIYGHPFPASSAGRMEAVGLMLGIGAPPLISVGVVGSLGRK